MKILLIDNRTDYLANVKAALGGHEIEVQRYEPDLTFHHEGKDLIVLSGGGGEGFELKDKYRGKLWYQDEMNFILACQKPIVGICMGFEVIAAAYGSKVKELPGLVRDLQPSKTTNRGQKHLGRSDLRQFEYHRYGIDEVNTRQFEVLAESLTGIEMIKHKTKPILASQFHPENPGGTLGLTNLIEALAIDI